MHEEPHLEECFPQLASIPYRLTSPETSDYNCIAWAAQDDTRWWWPDPMGQSYWPRGLPREETLEAFKEAYGMLGFIPCEDGRAEPGYEKIAIYSKGRETTHAARQLPNGWWTSKLGEFEDIEHQTPGGVEGTNYGTVSVFMKRPIQ